MDYSILIQVVVAGVATGGVYGLIALGFVLIYKATSVLNLAMGEFMTLGAFICFTSLTMLHVPFYIAFFITIVFAVILGIIIEPLILRPMIGEPVISVMGPWFGRD
jgi:branched-chain amino acid transport system permease protein